MKRVLCLLLAALLLCPLFTGCTQAGDAAVPEESAAPTPAPQATEVPRDRSLDLSWAQAFRSSKLPEGSLSPEEIAFYSVDDDGAVSIVNVPKTEVYQSVESMGALPRTRYYEQFMPEQLESLYPVLDYAMAHDYCRFSIPTTQFNGQDIAFSAQYLRLTYRINNTGIGALSVTSRELPDGETLDYVLVTLPGMDSRGRMAQYRQALARAREIVAEIPEGAGEYDKALYLYQWLTDNVRYDYNDYYDSDWTLLYDTLIRKRTVCAGYAEALYVLYNLAGIECFTVDGYLNRPDGDGYHIWNVARIDGTYYQFDATWDEGVEPGWYRFFGVSDARLQSYYPRHIETLAEEYCPACVEELPLPDGEGAAGRPADLAEGSFADGVYTQPFAELSLTLGPGWEAGDRQQIGEMFYGTQDFAQASLEDYLSAGVSFVDLYAEDDRGSIYALLERAPLQTGAGFEVRTPAEYMDAMRETIPMEYRAMGLEIDTDERFRAEYAGKQWEGYRMTATVNGTPIIQTMLCTEKQGILFTFYLTSYGTDRSEEVFSGLR